MGNEEDSEFVVALFPTAAIEKIAPHAPDVAGTVINGRQGVGGIVFDYLTSLSHHMSTLNGTGGRHVARIGLDLIGTLLATHSPGSEEHDTWRNILSYIDHHLADESLSPSTIAAAHHMSLRSLHNLFHQHGETVAAWIRKERLERSYAELRDPGLSHLRIADIGSRCGIPDPSQFSRNFKEHYGMSPREVRQQT